ncbi:hypothetical protein FRC02_002747 [Tulasnella sp. 418]|nr:hypothetical protein FRC02_002747 [Tulasnella sp. 418]
MRHISQLVDVGQIPPAFLCKVPWLIRFLEFTSLLIQRQAAASNLLPQQGSSGPKFPHVQTCLPPEHLQLPELGSGLWPASRLGHDDPLFLQNATTTFLRPLLRRKKRRLKWAFKYRDDHAGLVEVRKVIVLSRAHLKWRLMR